MTDKQKNAIASLRREGYGYGKIADALGINKNTVKSYCRRHGVEKIKHDSSGDETVFCRNCGAFVKQIQGRKKKLYCSDKCRQTWWKEHPEMLNHKAMYDYVCPECGNTFQAYGNAHRKYCSHDCYIKHRFEADIPSA